MEQNHQLVREGEIKKQLEYNILISLDSQV